LSNSSPDPQAQLAWHADRVAIADCLLRYARCIDERDWDGLQSLYAEDGVMQHGDSAVSREQVPALSEAILSGVAASHHQVSEALIEIDGDVARTHSHYFATHIGDAGAVIRQAGGWYDCELRRGDSGWQFTRVRSTTAWRSGAPLRLH
jgi:ketosteroid isomerase-like protein